MVYKHAISTVVPAKNVKLASIDESNDLQSCNATDEELEITNA